MISRFALVVAVGVVLLAAAGTAQASSIVFVRGGDVWLTTPDGSREHRVTSGQDIRAVTQAEDGTIFAWRPGQLYKLDQNGNQLAPPKTTIDMFDLDVSPDGRRLAFWYVLSNGRYFDALNSDGSEAPWDDNNGSYPQWMDNAGVLRSNDAGYVAVQYQGNGNYYNWFGEPDGKKFGVAITRAKDRLVAVVRDYSETGPWTVAHYSNSSQPPVSDAGHILRPPDDPAQRPALRCTVDMGSVEPSHPRFSPDGTQIAWELPDGIHVQPVLDLNSCSQPAGGFTIAGAKSPDWGPADVPVDVIAGSKCVVPKLKGKKLVKAKKLLKKAHCKAGKVKKAKSRRGRGTVIKQSPKPKAVRSAGTKVRLTVAR
jgi:PASTA domain/WD40-like Beta Propeller Repeat